MDEEKKQKHSERIVRDQLRRDELKEALRSHFKVQAHDGRFNKLLERLEQAEQDQSKR